MKNSVEDSQKIKNRITTKCGDSTSEYVSKRIESSQALVVHTCNPSYSGGRDQEDHSSKPAQANSS
jgi:hypothetical protein